MCADAAEAGVVVFHEAFGLIKPDRLFRVGLIGAAQQIDGLSDIAGLIRFEALVIAVIVVDKKHIVSAGCGAAAEVIHGAGRERVFDRFTMVFVKKPLGCGPRFTEIAADGPEGTAGIGAQGAEEATIRELDQGGFLTDADGVRFLRGNRERGIVEGEPGDADILGFGGVIDILKAHKFYARIPSGPGFAKGRFGLGA